MEITANGVTKNSPATKIRRYAEGTASVGFGAEVGHDEQADNDLSQTVEGDLDVDVAELSLGQRLTALSGGKPTTSSEDEDSDGGQKAPKSGRDAKAKAEPLVPANSLTRTLIQALHSSDAKLTETCLSHSDPILINNTVRRLPPQLAVSLIDACVERLGRGARGANVKGRGGGASSQRGAALITWIRTVLIIHSGHLMTMPNLIARLSGLHATLTRRLALQESLLSLNGRLDMVLTQIEMRSSVAPTPLSIPREKKATKQRARKARQYVEGESEEEGVQMDVEVDADSGDEGGSIEDVELGGGSDEEDEETSEEEEDEDDGSEEDDDEDEEGPTLNGFIDDEAEEDDEDDESD
ncbi:Small subunit (SSU) processome component [Pleurotus ostreatus]|uniref:Small subunit (SSU) processome component n=1 Tax=Pleurotus ostreatus TaxID=5322 RepID=A0A8H7A351_PLEOS|nr:Small subunit (SSU) processome component [Pleurotus ostreatus]KAF7437237.1 Small subunit (SSU) processome component [Pleurotus ostreatus]